MTRKPYSTDLTDLQWANIEHLIPGPKSGGRPRKHSNRDLLDAIFYIVRAGCVWRLLPHDFPHWLSVYAFFRQWQEDGTWQRVHDALREDVRHAEDRDDPPTAGILDSQSVKTTSRGGERGYDAGKKNRRTQKAPVGGLSGSDTDGGRSSSRHTGSRRRQIGS